MANQPKRYKKFVATAATATLVASAIAPVASASFKDVADNNDHKKNIEAIAELGYMGAGDNFRPSENVTRGQVAIILANWAQDVAGLEVPADYKTVQRFKDVPLTADDKLLQSAALVKDYGIFEGSNGNLNGANPISREHMALVLNKAFEAVNGTSLVDLAGDTSDVTFADEAKINKNYLPVVKALKKLGITAPASFNPSGNVTRGQFATFFIQTNNQDVEAKVASVSAINDKTLKVTGSGLKGLEVADITVETNTVASVSAAADGKSATITLSSSLIPGQDTKVTIKDSESTKDYTVNYKLEATTVELVSATFDDDLANQKVQLKVNGSLVDADYLSLSGYSVNFVAVEKTKPALSGKALFAGPTNQSTTGILNTGLTVGAEYEVEVQIAKAGVATISAKGTVKIANIHAQAQAIEKLRFVNGGIDATVATTTLDSTINGVGVPSAGTDDFFMNSSTVVAGEKFQVNHALITKSGEKTAVSALTDIKVTSSNPAVLSVDPTTRVITAESAGTAVISVEIGGVKKDTTFTVTNTKRKLARVTSKDATVNVINGNATPVNVELTAVDQFGDPFGISAGAASISTDTPPVTAVDEVIPTKTDGVTKLLTATGLAKFDVVTTTNSASVKYGTAVITLDGTADVNTGSGTVYIKNKAGETVGAFVLNVTEVNNTSNIKTEIKNTKAVGYSADRSLEITDDATVRFELAKYNSQNIYAGALDLNAGTVDNGGPYVISVVNPEIANVKSEKQTTAAATITASTASDTYFEVVGLKAGTTDVLVKDKNGVVVAKETITVTNNPYKISNVSWKQVPTIDYATKVLKTKDVLTVVETSGTDAIVEGITLNKSTSHKVRVATVAVPTDGALKALPVDGLYLDANGNGKYDLGDTVLGAITATVTSGSVLGGAGPLATSQTVAAVTATGTTATQAGDEATLIFKIMTDLADPTTSIASTTVNVKVGN